MNELASIVVVEDDAVIRAVLEMALAAEGFTKVVGCARGDEGLTAIRRRKPDLALLDVMLPGVDGFAICRRIREPPALSGTRIVMITARTQSEDIVWGLECGAADYVTKPYRKRELLARINKVLKDRGKLSAELTYGDLRVDTAKGNAYKNGEELYLSRLEYRLLLLFMNNPGKLFTRDALLDEIWDVTGEYISDNTLSVHIKRLREKLGDDAQDPQLIKTVRGMGYKLGE